REDLANLDERGTEFLERCAQALRLPAASHGAFLIWNREKFPQPMLRKNSSDLSSTCEPMRSVRVQIRLRRPRTESCGNGIERVDHDYNTSGVVADPVGHVPEEKLFTTRHAHVIDNKNVHTILLSRANDDHCRIVVHDNLSVS